MLHLWSLLHEHHFDNSRWKLHIYCILVTLVAFKWYCMTDNIALLIEDFDYRNIGLWKCGHHACIFRVCSRLQTIRLLRPWRTSTKCHHLTDESFRRRKFVNIFWVIWTAVSLRTSFDQVCVSVKQLSQAQLEFLLGNKAHRFPLLCDYPFCQGMVAR